MEAFDAARMALAIAQGDLARGSTGDNPWVGCVVTDARDEVLAVGHTQGPGEDHAEIAALRDARARGLHVVGATMYSTLEPCSFHGRTPACSRVVAQSGVRRVVIGMRDPHPRVDGEGIGILRGQGLDVIEGVCEAAVRRQLGGWVLAQHPHEVRRRARELARRWPAQDLPAALAEIYGIELPEALGVLASLDG